MKMRGFILVGVFALFVLVGRLWWFYLHLPVYRDGDWVGFTATLSEEPQFILGRQRFGLKDGNGVGVGVTTGMSPSWHYGDRMRVSGVLRVREFKGRRIYSLVFPKLQRVSGEMNWVSSAANYLRGRATELYEKTLPPVASSLLLGVVFGGKQGMPDEFLKSLRAVGVMHVIAASGMNVTFVAGALISVLGRFLSRRVALSIGILGVVFYSFLAGFEASILRASIMAILAFSAQLLGRQYMGVFSLFLTAFVLLFYSPLLLFDVGFQLSFLSTLGILVVQPVLSLPGWLVFKEDLGTTISAQLATLPVMLGVFGQYGWWSVLVNGLVLWMIPFLMTLGAVGFLLGLVVEPLGQVFLYLCLPFLWLFAWVVEFFGGLGGVWEVGEFPWSLGVGYYLVLGAWVGWRREVQRSKVKNQSHSSKSKNF